MNIIRPVEVSLVSISGAIDADPVWGAATTYSTGSRVRRHGKIYVSSIDGNLGKDPALELQDKEGARWIFVAVQNTTAFMDGSQNAKTVGTGPLVIEVQASDVFNSIALLDLECSECKVEVITGGAARTVATIKTGAQPVHNWWDWLHSVFYKNNRRHIVSNAAGLGGSKVRLTISGTSVWLGELVIGQDVNIGKTQMDSATKVARRTFTAIKTNDFGTTTVQKRAVARDVTYLVHAKRDGFEAKERLLDDVDGIRVVTYAVNDDWAQLINVGYVTDYVLPAEFPDDFSFSITTQGVT